MIDKDLEIERLTKALEAKGEPVAWYAQDNLEVHDEIEVIWSSKKPTYAEVWIPLYIAPPSTDALIAQAIEDYIAKNTLIKSVNLRTQAQPYLDELIAEIDEMVGNEHVVYCDQLITALNKWRTK